MDWRPYQASRVRIIGNHKTDGAIDPVRGCTGCELTSDCYARKMARIGRTEHGTPIRQILDSVFLAKQVKRYAQHSHSWIRIGCVGDPSFDWELTTDVCRIVHDAGVTPVIVSKIHQEIPRDLAASIAETSLLQVSVSGLQTERQRETRLTTLLRHRTLGGRVGMRFVSARWLEGSAPDEEQRALTFWAQSHGVAILDTPLRLNRCGPSWALVEQSAYHRHCSPMSGALATEYTAGLVIEGALPCYSTCSPVWRAAYDPGCAHQCGTTAVRCG
jgi:hypothetical protein